MYQWQRRAIYEAAWRTLRDTDVIYPRTVSRKELRDAAHAPHEDEESEPIFPPERRPPLGTGTDADSPAGVV